LEKQLAFCDVQRPPRPVENVPGHRDHHSRELIKLIMIGPEWVITIVRNPDHDQSGISDHDRPESLITIVRNPHC
jgi:hypothetical protein